MTIGPETNAPRRQAGDAIRSALMFAGLILTIALGARLATRFGMLDDADFSRRTTMVILGAYLMFIGNAMPKTLTPLSALRCDASQVQAFQRFAGWTWTLTGLALAIIWLALPVALARTVSVVLILAGILTIVRRILRLRARRKPV
jgi:hypothetical protein